MYIEEALRTYIEETLRIYVVETLRIYVHKCYHSSHRMYLYYIGDCDVGMHALHVHTVLHS